MYLNDGVFIRDKSDSIHFIVCLNVASYAADRCLRIGFWQWSGTHLQKACLAGTQDCLLVGQ